ncbi:N,N-dimethylformamidase beta subunit family domain-containing protein, partial [Arthrobacter sp. MI7-26]|uniref:N,N-dimethylformamidase beta subunit family domain-containing protein n=1 Tax=Arthrobacter sp. MI7-26 TaxID=2993653 RepID=UPI00224992A9
MSANPGDTVTFKIKTPAASYHFDILRLGYYQGLGARKIAAGLRPAAALPQAQPACLTDSTTGLIDCGNWGVSASWAVPATAVSGVYIAHLVRDDTGGSSVIPFVVRNDAGSSKLIFQTSDETWQAYNTYGGNSLYSCTVACPPGSPQTYKGAFKVSYNRPFHSAEDDGGNSWLMSTEYPMIRFLESNGYDVSYMSGLDVATKGSLLLNHNTFLSVGHDEYWSVDQRANVQAARDHGVNLAFFSGNEMFWRTRWEPSVAGPSTPGRTLVAYKDTHFDAPTDPVTWTGTWRDPRFGTAGGGGNPENSLTGQFFLVNSGTADIKVPDTFAKQRLWRNTAAASLAAGQTLTLGSGIGTLGYEWDIDADNGFRPAGLFKLSATTNTSAEVFTDYGSQTARGKTATHNLTMYKAPSGALVFGAGTVQWSWGLDDFTTGKATDRNMQQATVNLFADMGTQPATLAAGLVPATASTDTTAPISTITSPVTGTGLADGAKLTISGTATDVGGVVAGVEVSTDGGTSWHPANGTTNWTYTWLAHGSPASTIKVRATDDSGNIQGSPASVTVNIPCPCSVYGTNALPAGVDSGDPNSVEVGVKFTSDAAGTINAIRFYKSTRNTGTHVGNLWTSAGQLLATGNFSGETATGWQTLTFAHPVAVAANTTYVASYFAPVGHYSQEEDYFYPHPSASPAGNNSVDSPPLHFLRNTPSNPNGLYGYSSSSTFPTQTYHAEYYWIDVVFNPSAPAAPAVSSTSPASGATSVAVNAAVSATFNQAVTAGSVGFTLKDSANASVAGTVSYDGATNTSTFTPSAALAYGTSYTATVSGATNSTGQTMASPYSWTFTTVSAPPAPAVSSTSPASGATSVAVNAAVSATFNQAVTPGSVGFTLKDSANASVAGTVSYNSATNTSTFTTSAALAYGTSYTATVSGATNSSGQTMASPYSWTFTNVSAPPAPAVTSTSPAPGATSVAVNAAVSATFNQAVTPGSVG